MPPLSHILGVLRTDPGHPLPVQPVQVGAPGAPPAVPPPLPALQGYNELTGGPHGEMNIGPVALSVGGQVGILKKDLLLDLLHLPLFGGQVQLVDGAVLPPAILWQKLLKQLHKFRVVHRRQLGQPDGRVQLRALICELNDPQQFIPFTVVCVDPVPLDLPLQTFEPFHKLRGQPQDSIAVIQLLGVVAGGPGHHDADVPSLMPEDFGALGMDLIDDLLLLLIGDGPAHDPGAVVLIVTDGQIAALPAHAVVVGLMDQSGVQGLYDDFHDDLLSNCGVVGFKGLPEPAEERFTGPHLFHGQAQDLQRFAQVSGDPVFAVCQLLAEHIQDVALSGCVGLDSLQVLPRVPVQNLLQAGGVAFAEVHPGYPTADQLDVHFWPQPQAPHPLSKLLHVVGKEAGESVELIVVLLLQFCIGVHFTVPPI